MERSKGTTDSSRRPKASLASRLQFWIIMKRSAYYEQLNTYAPITVRMDVNPTIEEAARYFYFGYAQLYGWPELREAIEANAKADRHLVRTCIRETVYLHGVEQHKLRLKEPKEAWDYLDCREWARLQVCNAFAVSPDE